MFISRPKAGLTAAFCLAAGFLPNSATAKISFIIDETNLVDTLHTQLYSSPRLPSPDKIQLAAVCFVTDMSECEDNIFGNSSNPPDYELDPEERCKNEGYTITSCPDGYKAGGKKCPYGAYYTECVKACPSNYVTCEAPYYGIGEIQDGEGCLDCDGIKKYKVKVNPCEGFQDCGSMGGETGAATCQSGDVIKYDNCKPCPNLGKYTTCPQGMTCEYEECSGLWYMTDCQNDHTYYCGFCPTY